MNIEYYENPYGYTFIDYPKFGICLKKKKGCTLKEHPAKMIVYDEELAKKLDEPDGKKHSMSKEELEEFYTDTTGYCKRTLSKPELWRATIAWIRDIVNCLQTMREDQMKLDLIRELGKVLQDCYEILNEVSNPYAIHIEL